MDTEVQELRQYQREMREVRVIIHVYLQRLNDPPFIKSGNHRLMDKARVS